MSWRTGAAVLLACAPWCLGHAVIANDTRVILEGVLTGEVAMVLPPYLVTIEHTDYEPDSADGFEIDLIFTSNDQLEGHGEVGGWLLEEWESLLEESDGFDYSTAPEPTPAGLVYPIADAFVFSVDSISVLLSLSDAIDEEAVDIKSARGALVLVGRAASCDPYYGCTQSAPDRIYGTIDYSGLAYGDNGSPIGNRPLNDYNDLGVPIGGELFTDGEPAVLVGYFDVLSIRVVPEPGSGWLLLIALGAIPCRRR